MTDSLHGLCPPSRLKWLWLCGVFICIFAIRLLIIDHYGTDLPMADQWGKEADWIIGPMREGKPWLERFLLPHNEHRIYWTLIVDIGLVELTGQWDARVQATVSALLYATIMTTLGLWLYNACADRTRGAYLAALAVLAVAPLAWENIIWGFQSCFYFLIGFSLLAMFGLLCRPVGSRLWWSAVIVGLLALVAMGSGFLWPIVVLPLIIVRHATGQLCRPAFWINAGVCLGTFAFGWYLSFSPPWHDSLHATGPRDFVAYAAYCLSWPLTDEAWPLLIWYAPFFIWLWSAIKNRTVHENQAWPVACILWCLLQTGALAYARGAGGGTPATRYGDVLAIGLFGNIALLAVSGAARIAAKPLLRFASWSWIALVVGSLAYASVSVLGEELPAARQQAELAVAGTREYLETGDVAALAQHPFPFKEWLQRILSRPGVQDVLPKSISPSLSATESLVSRWTRVLASRADVLLAAGLGLIAAAGLWSRIECRQSQAAGAINPAAAHDPDPAKRSMTARRRRP